TRFRHRELSDWEQTKHIVDTSLVTLRTKFRNSFPRVIEKTGISATLAARLRKTTFDCSENLSCAALQTAEIALLLLIQKESFKGRSTPHYEELVTVLCDCGGIINLRPLSYVSDDVRDFSPLTPERFLREIPKSGVPDIDLVDEEKLSKRAKYIQSMRDQLRKRFRSEYLVQLCHQSVKNRQIKPLNVGE
ncbi:integrase catalytic domain-containing protein, partial [Trichonephila clavipes]